jgi:hypothetical protein
MAGILNKKKRFIDFVITSHGKRKLAQNSFIPEIASLTDRHIFYDNKETNIQSSNNYERIAIETLSAQSTDVIVYEFDDSGKLFLHDISGSSIVGNKIFSYDENNKEDIKKYIATGSMFASNNGLKNESIKRFKINKFIRTTDIHENANLDFKITPNNHTFVMSNSVPFPKGAITEAINIDNAEPLMFDDKLAHFKNFQYLTPKNKNGSEVGSYEDLRGLSRKNYQDIKNTLRITNINDNFLNQNETVVNSVVLSPDESLKVLNRGPLKDITTKISKEHVSINFSNTSYDNNVLLQIYEKNINKNELIKLDIVDAGEFNDETDKNRQKKHVYYVGKVFKDTEDNNTFVNLFTLIWD